jgi:hypothetical protein
MGTFGNIFSPSDLPYPTVTPAAQMPQASTPTAPPAAPGFWNRIFAPADLPYPLPVAVVQQAQSAPASSGSGGSAPAQSSTPTDPPPSGGASGAPASSTNAQSTNPQSTNAQNANAQNGVSVPSSAQSLPSTSPVVTSAPPQSPVTVVVMQAPAAPPAVPAPIVDKPASTDDNKPSTPAPVPTATTCPAAPPDATATLYSLNPRLRARRPQAHEVYIEDILDEKITVRMRESHADPVTFTVPDGCNAVDFFLAPIEINPGVGCEDDREEVIAVGDLLVQPPAGVPLVPGEEVHVVVPWRYASWIEMQPGHLRLPITARFRNLT